MITIFLLNVGFLDLAFPYLSFLEYFIFYFLFPKLQCFRNNVILQNDVSKIRIAIYTFKSTS